MRLTTSRRSQRCDVYGSCSVHSPVIFHFSLFPAFTFIYFPPVDFSFILSGYILPAPLSLSLHPFFSLCCLVVGVSWCHLISITTVVIHDKRCFGWKRDYSHRRHGNSIVPHSPTTRGDCSAGPWNPCDIFDHCSHLQTESLDLNTLYIRISILSPFCCMHLRFTVKK